MDRFSRALDRPLATPEWKRAAQKLSLCRHPSSLDWIGGRDRLGELESWMGPAPCGLRLCDDCSAPAARAAILDLEAERKVYGERALSMATLGFSNCGDETCRRLAWVAAVPLAAAWRDAMRYEERLRTGTWVQAKESLRIRLKLGPVPPRARAVTVLEEHKSHWPHVHMVLRQLPIATELRTVERYGKWVEREIAVGQVLKRARARWHNLSGSWVAFWELVALDPTYIAGYLEKLSKLPNDTKALLTSCRVRMYSRSPESVKVQEPRSRWEVCRGLPGKVLRFTGLPFRPSPGPLDTPPPLWQFELS